MTAVSSDANTVLNLFCIPEGFLAKRFVETDLQSDNPAPDHNPVRQRLLLQKQSKKEYSKKDSFVEKDRDESVKLHHACDPDHYK